MITYGKINLDIKSDDLNSLVFTDYQKCYTQYKTLEKYYNEYNSSVYQMFDEDVPMWAKELVNKISYSFKHYVVSLIKINPGQTVPHHLDKHFKIKEKYGDGKTDRFLIFLENWKRGHYFEIQDQPYIKWNCGDWVKFGPDDWHIGGNMGDEPLYLAQITVLY